MQQKDYTRHFYENYIYLCILFLGQMFLMDRFFNGAFLTFGLEVIAFAERDQECTHTQHFSHDKFSLLGQNCIGTNFPLWDKILKWQIFPTWTNSHFGKFSHTNFPWYMNSLYDKFTKQNQKLISPLDNFSLCQIFPCTKLP